ncbi:hypothetical protein CC78DRAFT_243296 [Lojkania enalia]|uniref:Uncharacterized protein n=1 Tax=Lojkania enalia TaxID=147567 RepID=A0A9P4NBC1_9PLEO|nr:hypothetical protein CC78DRAFT_243296 [Didymosphaeria enalia]
MRPIPIVMLARKELVSCALDNITRCKKSNAESYSNRVELCIICKQIACGRRCSLLRAFVESSPFVLAFVLQLFTRVYSASPVIISVISLVLFPARELRITFWIISSTASQSLVSIGNRSVLK